MNAPSDLGVLLQIEARALEAQALPALRFTIVNETHALTPYRQAAMFELEGDRLVLTAASGLVSVANESPFAVWLSRFAQRFPRDGALIRGKNQFLVARSIGLIWPMPRPRTPPAGGNGSPSTWRWCRCATARAHSKAS